MEPTTIKPATSAFPAGVRVLGPVSAEFAQILTSDALQFLATLTRAFSSTRTALLLQREERQARIDAGSLPDFLPETAAIRAADWTVAPVPHDLQDRRVEITGPASDRKMVINA